MDNHQNNCARVCMLSCISCVWLFVTLWTIACLSSLSIGFFRQEYGSGLPCPPPGGLLYPGIKPAIFLCLQHWQMCSVPLSYLWTPRTTSAKGNQLQSQWKMEVNIRVDTTILIHPQNVHSISFMRVDDNFVLLAMKDTPYNEIEFPPLNATLRQFSLYFPEMQPESELKDCPY